MLVGTEFQAGLMKKVWRQVVVIDMVNVFNAVELYTLKRLKRSILCYIYFTSVKQIAKIPLCPQGPFTYSASWGLGEALPFPSAGSALSLPRLTCPSLAHPLLMALTRPQVQGNLLWRHLNDI